MESKNLLTLAITLTVGIILAGSLLMPVISDATTTEKTFMNEGIYYIVDDDESHTFQFNAGVITVDGETVTYTAGKEYTVLATNDVMFRLNTAGNALQLRGAVSASVTSCDLTIANGTVSGTYNTSTSFERSYTSYYLATSATEPLIMKDYTGTAYIMKDDLVLGRGLTQLNLGGNSTYFYYFQIDASVENGVTIEPIEGFTFSDAVINTTAVDGYNDLYKFQSITFKATYDDTGAETNVTYTAVILPSEVTAELSQHLAPAEVAILNALPVLIIVALVVMAAGALYLKRDD